MYIHTTFVVTNYCPLCEKYPYSEYFWYVFSRIWTEYGEILRISPHSVQMRENTDQKNSEYGHFSRSDQLGQWKLISSVEESEN